MSLFEQNLQKHFDILIENNFHQLMNHLVAKGYNYNSYIDPSINKAQIVNGLMAQMGQNNFIIPQVDAEELNQIPQMDIQMQY